MDLTPAAFAAQARELACHRPCCPDDVQRIAAALGAVCDAAREQERDLKCAWDSRACEAHQPLYAEQEECPFCHAVKLASEVRQLREGLETATNVLEAYNLDPRVHASNIVAELRRLLAATEPSHG